MLDFGVPENWPNEIKQILNKLTEEDRGIIVDHMTRSYMAGYFDGEGGFQIQYGGAVPCIGSQDIECLQLYLDRYGGHIGLGHEKGKKLPIYVDGEKVPGAYTKINRDCYRWTMTDKRRGRSSRGYILKTEFLLEVLPYQHNQSKITQSIEAIIALGWSARARWEHLVPKDVDVCLLEDNRIDVDEFFE